MADYPPPTKNLPQFTPSVFRTNDTHLTLPEAENYFLTFPTAQGSANIPNLTTGTISVSGNVNLTNSSSKATVYGFETTTPTGTGEHNTALGYQAGRGFNTLTTTGGNSALGALAMNNVNIVGATNNTAVGSRSLFGLTSGTNNTYVGFNFTSVNTTTESNNTALGYTARCAAGVSGSTAIGAATFVSASNQVVLGGSADTVGLWTRTPLYSTIPTSLDATERLSFPTGAPVGSRCFATQANAGFVLLTNNISAFISFTTIPRGVYAFSGYFNFKPYTNPAFGGYIQSTEGTRSRITATTVGGTTLNVSNISGIWINASSSATFSFNINNTGHTYTKAAGTIIKVSLVRIA